MPSKPMKYYYDNLRDIYSTICNEEVKKKSKLIKEYGGYRTTASGRRVERDEPGQDLEIRQANRIRANELDRVKKVGAARLRAKGAIPTRKDGTKTFEQFRLDAGAPITEELTKKQTELMRQVHASSQHLSYDKWMLFITTMLEPV